MHDKWRKSLEMIFPSGFTIDDKLLVEFHLQKKGDMDQIDVFLNEFNDWHQDKLHESEAKFKKLSESADRPLMKPMTTDIKINVQLFKSCPTTKTLLPNFQEASEKKEKSKEEHMKEMVQQSIQSSNINPTILEHYQTSFNQKGVVNKELKELTESKADASVAELQEAWQNLEMDLARQHSKSSGVPLDMGSATKLSRGSSRRWKNSKAAATSTDDQSTKDITYETTSSSSTTMYWIAASLASIAIGAGIAIKMKQQ